MRPPKLTAKQRAEIINALRRVKLPDAARIDAELRRRLTIWKPQHGPQTEAYASPANIIGYGGAAGGG